VPDDETLGEQFWAVARRLRRRSGAAMAAWDVAPSHARALTVLDHDGPLRLGALAERLHVAARSATEVVDALEARGLVRREPDRSDRRATLVSLTDRGRRTSADIHRVRHDQAAEFFGSLTAAEQAALRRILTKLAREDGQP